MSLRMAEEFMSIYIFPVRFEQSTVATYDRISKLFIIYMHIYLLFSFTDRVRGTKNEQSDVAKYGRRIHAYIFSGYSYLADVSSLDCG